MILEAERWYPTSASVVRFPPAGDAMTHTDIDAGNDESRHL